MRLFNELNLGSLTVSEARLLALIIKESRTENILIGEDQLRKIFNGQLDSVPCAMKDLGKLATVVQVNGYYEPITLFNRFRIFELPYRIEVQVNPFFDLKNARIADMVDFARLRTSRAKALYQLLSESNVVTLSLEEVYDLFDVPETYKENRKYIKDKILNGATKECARFFSKLNLETVKDPVKKGHPVVGYEWRY